MAEAQSIEVRFRSTEDFTFYRRADDFERELSNSLPESVGKPRGAPPTQRIKSVKSFPARMTLTNKDGGRRVTARVMACRCFEGHRWSLTCRLDTTSFGREEKEQFDKQISSEWKQARTPESNYAPSTDTSGSLNTAAELCKELADRIFRGEFENRKGLLVIAGATKSGKTTIARGLIHTLLQKIKMPDFKRPPHLVTLEDPIECYYSGGQQGSPETLLYR